MVYRIVVPLDGSPASEQALPVALGIAQRDRAAIELVHVHESLPPYRTQGAPTLDPGLDDELRKGGERYLEAVARRLRQNTGVEARHTLLDGPISATLAEHIKTQRADLVVMTTHGRSGLSRMWLGSTAVDMVRRLECPVLLVRPDESAKATTAHEPSRSFQRTLLPLDGSPAAEAAIDHALAVVGDVGAFVLLHVMLPLMYFAPEPSSLVYPDETEMQTATEDYLQRVAAPMRARGMDVETHVVRHPVPARAIVDFAESSGVDLIAMETHGRTGVSRLLMGSVADKVVRSAPVPVLVHRPPSESKSERGAAIGEQPGELVESGAPRS
ncbi:MAG TPA: universal stress protein [Gemmatimonadaceae bacterium]